MSQLKVLVLLVIFTFVNAIDDELIVTTPLGKVIGYYKISHNGRRYKAYEGIPYAEPPIENLRFEEPIPIAPWHLLNATFIKSVCAQYIDEPPDENGQKVIKGRVKGQDDCLYLNIYVPVLEKNVKKKLPVLFFIHGGSFQYGSGNKGPQYILDRNVIFLTINYRLGIQGFLSTEDEVLPGNLGLKDQSLALRWVSNNIEYFCGDSKRITIVGFSAGSSSVQYHYLSPLSRGLFSNGIAIGGSVFNPWGFAKSAKEKAKKLGAIFKCPTGDSRKMIDCLKKVPAQSLAGAIKKFQSFYYMPEAPFAPVVERFGKNPFINRSPEEIFEAKAINDVPIVFTTVINEGGDPAAGYVSHDNILKDLNDNWIDIAPHLLQYNYTLPRYLHKKLAIAARKEYFGNQTIDKRTGSQLIQMLTDKHYHVGIERAVRLHAKASKSLVYFYLYSRKGSQSYSDHLSHTKNNYGVIHCDDVYLVLGNPYINASNTPDDLKMSNFLLDIWESVAYTGVPKIDVEWKPVNVDDTELRYLLIKEIGEYKMSATSNFGNKMFWRQYLKN